MVSRFRIHAISIMRPPRLPRLLPLLCYRLYKSCREPMVMCWEETRDPIEQKGVRSHHHPALLALHRLESNRGRLFWRRQGSTFKLAAIIIFIEFQGAHAGVDKRRVGDVRLYASRVHAGAFTHLTPVLTSFTPVTIITGSSGPCWCS
jgi:hypothetical protein